MRDYECQHEPLNRGVYTSESQKSHCCEQCGSTETPERNEIRGEIFCPTCGMISVEKLYDELNPKTHANTNDNNSGRGTLGPSKPFGIKDHTGAAISSKDRKKWARLNKINTTIHRDAEDSNKVVEESIEQLKKLNYTLSKTKEKEYRKLLMDTLKTQEGDNLFKTGTQYNAIACALVLHSDIDRRMFFEMLRDYAKANNLDKRAKQSIRRRGLQIRGILNSKLGNHSNQRAPVYPHIIDVNSRPSEIHEAFIAQWWGKKIGAIRTYSEPPKYHVIIKLINTILDKPEILELKGGEMLEPILDACLLISMTHNCPSRTSGNVTEKLSLTAKSRNYSVRLKTFLDQDC